MLTLLATVFVASLLGSLHCAGMCGPFVAFICGGGSGDGRGEGGACDGGAGRLGWRVAAAYHTGRLITYTALGLIAGSLGAALDLGGTMVGVSRVAAVLAGAVMVIGGGAALLRIRGLRVWRRSVPPTGPTPGPIQRTLFAAQRAAMRLTPARRALAIGLLSTLLPCGWLWAFAATAAGVAHPAWGAAVMLAFWSGTLPIMLGLGLGLRTLTAALGDRLPVVTAAAIIVVGLVTIAVRLHVDPAMFDLLSPAHAATSTTSPANATDSASTPTRTVPTTPPCHDHVKP
ncbi:MAG: sulfite exporter TauE/SafE family protein [Phycisphaera sp.]|nr:sulfite exporter TauE/SafE family protein [Phycisphaera sp.]